MMRRWIAGWIAAGWITAAWIAAGGLGLAACGGSPAPEAARTAEGDDVGAAWTAGDDEALEASDRGGEN